MEPSSKYPSQTAERFQVRLPDGMRDKLRETADANNRSMNSEIIHRLSMSLEGLNIRPDLQKKLEERSRLMGRSIEAEIEFFVELGFAEQDKQDEMWSKDIRRQFEKEIENLYNQRSVSAVEKIHEKNMEGFKLLASQILRRVQDMETLFLNEAAIANELEVRKSADAKSD